MRISMQILTDRLRQNYPDCQMGSMSEEMNLKRPLFYQNGTDFKKNKVYIARERDITKALLAHHGDNLVLVVGDGFGQTGCRRRVCVSFRQGRIRKSCSIPSSGFLTHTIPGMNGCRTLPCLNGR